MSLDVWLKKEVAEIKEVYSKNITHNLNEMAGEAGIYYCMWQPETLDITKANQLIEPLEKGLEKLKNDPNYYKGFNPDNGWGSYEGLVEFVESYLAACKEHPDATIGTWR